MSSQKPPANRTEIISKFRENISDIWCDKFENEYYLEKWLIARDYDLQKAEQMVRNSMKWREQEDIDNLLNDFEIPAAFQKYGVGIFFGHDKEGRPIWYEPLGYMDPQGLFKSISRRDLIKIRVHAVEDLIINILPKRSAEEGRPINQTIAIFDMEHFGRRHLWKPAMDLVIEVTKLMEANYPESMSHLIIFNGSSLFRLAYKLVKPFLQPATQKKVMILNSNYQEDLLKLIDADQLPACYGGNLMGPGDDPRCSDRMRWGGTVPVSLYLNTHQHSMNKVHVKPKSKFKLSYFIEKPRSILYYEFSTREADINFGIYYIGTELKHDVHKIHSSKCTEVFKLSRIQSHLTIEKGTLNSLDMGYYLIEFDNTFSWTRSKHVLYHIEILDMAADEHEEPIKEETDSS